jgi:hypothetical protein
MGTTKSRKSRRNNSRPTAFTFLSSIALGSENEKPPDSDRQTSYTTADNVYYIEGENHQIGGKVINHFGRFA